MRIKMASVLLLGSLLFVSLPLQAKQIAWKAWVAELRQDAISQGIKPELFDRVFKHIRPRKRILHYDRSQPEKRITYQKYLKSRGDNYRIKLGKREYKKYQSLLDSIGQHYGVDPCVIVSLWGIESSYGRFMGNHSVITALATLAYDSRRSVFFRKELLYALHILNEGHISLKDFKGEWAGGSGQPQFLPSSWHHYAVDHDQDGKKDIWRTHADIFASIANYLSSHGWQAGEPKRITVLLPEHFDPSLLSLKVTKTVSQWQALGVNIPDMLTKKDANLEASIIQPYGGPTLMVFKNFKVIMKYNRSTFYAGTVSYMADKICHKRD